MNSLFWFVGRHGRSRGREVSEQPANPFLHTAAAGLLFVSLFFLPTVPADASEKTSFDPGDAEKIIQKFVRIKQRGPSRNWSWREERIDEQLGSDKRVSKTTRAIYEWRSQAEKRASRLLDLDGRPVIGPFIDETPSTEFSGWGVDEVARRFNFKIVKFEKVQNRDVARIHFSPKKHQPSPRNREEKVVSKLEGDLWVIVEEQQLVKALARLSKPVKFGGGILGEVSKLEIAFTEQPVDGEWVAESFLFEMRSRKFFSTTYFRQRRSYADYSQFFQARSAEKKRKDARSQRR